jgi:hypothetical protein
LLLNGFRPALISRLLATQPARLTPGRPAQGPLDTFASAVSLARFEEIPLGEPATVFDLTHFSVLSRGEFIH